MIIAIDGPAGAGKSTIARDVALALGFQLVDTGAIYRALAFKASELDVDFADGPALADLARSLTFRFELRDAENLVFCNGALLGPEIRTPDNSQAASKVSALPEVREALLDVQRDIGRSADSVLEGRDIGTVVFPDADVKVFLTATPEVRAQRRTLQFEEAGQSADYTEILEDIRVRDARDSNRMAAPLKQADDAVAIDSTMFGEAEVVRRILVLVSAATPS